ncbi:enolase-phosphatase E1 [Epichloe festucae Fl1]|uniref:Enolase-phosphatase E1 n=1 Tax=Epichloe festucae (strain Fl1) TaxID=877507 RepID=A0A7S9PTL0_EPIFF|nr:enolase-phosphatase E1 [Epichloe festucae Fl1]
MLAKAFAEFDVLVLDIEGTVCPITFVRDVLFPYALSALPCYLEQHWESSDFATYREAFPEDCRIDRGAFEAHIRDLVARDVKAPYLKALQGLLWQAGYASGELKAPLFPDVAPFITAAHAAGKRICIYSSGSVKAQKLLFAHTNGKPSDLTGCISGWFDTVNAGPKTEVDSYNTILSDLGSSDPSRCLFLSDNPKEVEAALLSGMQSLPVIRPGNASLLEDDYLSQIAIYDLSAESDERIQQCLATLGKTRRLLISKCRKTCDPGIVVRFT